MNHAKTVLLLCALLGALYVACNTNNKSSPKSQEKATDVLGYQDYEWGTPLVTILADLDGENVKYQKEENELTHETAIVSHRISMTFPEGSLSQSVIKSYSFQGEALVAGRMRYDHPLRSELDTTFSLFLKATTKTYGEPDSIREDKKYSTKTAYWDFKSTKIELTEDTWRDLGRVSITYWSKQ